MAEKLPRGIWFDAEKTRYRVRRYRNGKPYLRYRRTLEAALQVFEELKVELAKIPKLTREQMRRGLVPRATFAGMAKAMQS